MKHLVASLALILISSPAFAFWHEAKIYSIQTYMNGGIAVYLDNQHECGSNRLGFDESAPGFERIYASLLTYETQGKAIRFDVSSCNGTVGIVNRIVSIN